MEMKDNGMIVVGTRICSEIIITGRDNEVIAVISAREIIEKDGYQVEFRSCLT